MQASAGCWQVYNELIADTLTTPAGAVERWHHVDCFAVQHPGGAQADRRQRQSVAVHLVSLCLLHEFGQQPRRAPVRRGSTSRHVLAWAGLDDWPFLTPPADLGPVTVRDVRAASAGERVERMQAWATAAWSAWGAHHEVVRVWAAALQAQGR